MISDLSVQAIAGWIIIPALVFSAAYDAILTRLSLAIVPPYGKADVRKRLIAGILDMFVFGSDGGVGSPRVRGVTMYLRGWTTLVVATVAIASPLARPAAQSTGGVDISGELRQWHKVTLTLDGPQPTNVASDPNPVPRLPHDRALRARVRHPRSTACPDTSRRTGTPRTHPPSAGNKWRAHLSPDKPGRWDWRVSFVRGKDVAIDAVAAGRGAPVAPFDGLTGSFQVAATNKMRARFPGARPAGVRRRALPALRRHAATTS